jgi:hypothetical protein
MTQRAAVANRMEFYTEAVNGLNALTPFFPSLANEKPEWTRTLLSTQLLFDALSGALNFRNPNITEGYSLSGFIAPYLAIAGAGAVGRMYQ